MRARSSPASVGRGSCFTENYPQPDDYQKPVTRYTEKLPSRRPPDSGIDRLRRAQTELHVWTAARQLFGVVNQAVRRVCSFAKYPIPSGASPYRIRGIPVPGSFSSYRVQETRPSIFYWATPYRYSAAAQPLGAGLFLLHMAAQTRHFC